MTLFTIVTGVAGLISLCLQLTDLWPGYRKYFSHSAALLFGLTAGLVINITSKTTVNIPQAFRPIEIVGMALVGGTGILVAALMIAAIFIDDKERRELAKQSASSASFFLCLLLFGFLASLFPTSSTTKTPAAEAKQVPPADASK